MKKSLFIINDKLESYDPLFEKIKAEAPFETEIMPYRRFLSEELKERFAKLDPNDIFFAFEAGLFGFEHREISEYLRTIYNRLFTNILLLITAPELVKDDDVILGKKHCFYVHGSDPAAEHVNNFILYVIKLFNECVLSNRLLDYITHSFNHIVNSELLLKKKEEIELLNRELELKNKTDSLTNLYNRQAMFEFLDRESKRTMRDLWRISSFLKGEANAQLLTYDPRFGHEPVGDLLDHVGVFTVMMIDVDHFKRVNDTYGHLMGDEVLKTIGALLQDKTIFRESDILGRFGGEEFIGIFPSTNVNNALGPAMRFVKCLKEKNFQTKGLEPFKVSVSIGISEYHATDASKEEVIHRADKALYWAKEHGRDQIAVYEKLY
ncbi:MAG: GGDEF domain-containing protein [Spirochaetales bacterium]|nr:GGDEF domain-containing protein [Spirochaetales bacterium]